MVAGLRGGEEKGFRAKSNIRLGSLELRGQRAKERIYNVARGDCGPHAACACSMHIGIGMSIGVGEMATHNDE